MFATFGVPTEQVHECFLRACLQQQPVTVHPAGTHDARSWCGYLCVDGEGFAVISLPGDADEGDELHSGRLISGTFAVGGQQYYFRTTVRATPQPCHRPGCPRRQVQLHPPRGLAVVVPRQRFRARLPEDRQLVAFFEPLQELNRPGRRAPRFEALVAGVVPSGVLALAPPHVLVDTETHYRLAWTCPRTDHRRTLLVTVAHQYPRQPSRPRWLGLRCLPSDDFTLCRASLLELVDVSSKDAPAPTPAAKGPSPGT